MSSKLRELLDNENVDVAIPESRRGQRYDKIDKDALKNKLKTKEDFSKVQNKLLDSTFEERIAHIE